MFCGQCKYLKVDETEQQISLKHGVIVDHICLKYHKQVKHLGHHPHICKLDECKTDSEAKINQIENLNAMENDSKILRDAIVFEVKVNGGLAGVNYVNPDKIKWYKCPDCGQKLCRIDVGSKAEKIYLWCKHCKKEVEVNI